MTLATVSPYDPDQITERSGHAVVVGASMAGLLATRVLIDRFERVTLIEKDSLPDEPALRPGIPQARHIHVMQKAGLVTVENLFPGYSDDVIEAGGLVLDLASDVKLYQEGDFLAGGPMRIPQYTASRPVFEQVTRRRVAELDGVTILDECHFSNYLVDDQASTVEGVSVRTADGDRELDAELVVDATGRTSRTPAWLENNGYPAPPRDEVSIDLAYSTVLLERPAETRRAFLVLPHAPRTRGAAAFPIENGRWLLTLGGMHGDYPPTDPEGVLEYAASLPVADIGRLLEEHAWVSEDISYYPIPSSVRHRYEDLDRFPDGLVVIGDAVASFNPIYGQGMSVAALEALQFHHTLATDDQGGLALRFFERAAGVVDDAWSIAVGSDFQFPETTGPKPFGTNLVNRYVARLHRKAHTDGRLADAFNRVIIMENRPTSLFRPSVVWRVVKPSPRVRYG
ncbi:FAD-dependent oxidoreductase [Natrarchaeobius chitinivorans]|uniref:FAD-dependent monooxygenase n=1 Tax=Natrarchaeobius chitinivorans TaxID=1679083 RepID=A0A3N6LX06_NATCH|nr:FAD-dependent monooxygenase [Natrarchaeobius chitinivorans]RQG92274.1 FAD-dependent monooxygenase [Natrarchaeobius chitinivorans]